MVNPTSPRSRSETGRRLSRDASQTPPRHPRSGRSEPTPLTEWKDVGRNVLRHAAAIDLLQRRSARPSSLSGWVTPTSAPPTPNCRAELSFEERTSALTTPTRIVRETRGSFQKVGEVGGGQGAGSYDCAEALRGS